MVAYVTLAPVVAAIAERLPRRAFLVALDLIRAGVIAAVAIVLGLIVYGGCTAIVPLVNALFAPKAPRAAARAPYNGVPPAYGRVPAAALTPAPLPWWISLSIQWLTRAGALVQ